MPILIYHFLNITIKLLTKEIQNMHNGLRSIAKQNTIFLQKKPVCFVDIKD